MRKLCFSCSFCRCCHSKSEEIQMENEVPPQVPTIIVTQPSFTDSNEHLQELGVDVEIKKPPPEDSRYGDIAAMIFKLNADHVDNET